MYDFFVLRRYHDPPDRPPELSLRLLAGVCNRLHDPPDLCHVLFELPVDQILVRGDPVTRMD
jgi:hypothetical protein